MFAVTFLQMRASGHNASTKQHPLKVCNMFPNPTSHLTNADQQNMLGRCLVSSQKS
jgi:hypothetical protein